MEYSITKSSREMALTIGRVQNLSPHIYLVTNSLHQHFHFLVDSILRGRSYPDL
jgi:hypothetical protein